MDASLLMRSCISCFYERVKAIACNFCMRFMQECTQEAVKGGEGDEEGKGGIEIIR